MLGNIGERIQPHLDKAGGTWGIVIEDLVTKEKWTLNANQRFYAASLIKVPIMAAVFADVYDGKLNFEDSYELRQEDLVGGAGVLQHFTPGTPITVWDLTTLMIIQSDNTATNVLIDLIGKERIREMMQKTGMNNSQFYNKLMVVPAELEGYNELTAGDMANIFREIATGKVLSLHSSQQMIGILKKQQINDSLPLYLPDPDHDIVGGISRWEFAHKTGNVTNIQHDVGILYVGPHAVLISTLSKNVQANLARETMGRICEMIYQQYSS